MNLNDFRELAQTNPRVAEFVKALGGLAITLGEAVPEERILAYFLALRGYGLEPLLAAIHRATVTCRFFPKPAELVELITGAPGGGQDPDVAWQEVLHALEDVGSYGNVEFQDGAIAAAIEGLGGWSALGSLSYKEITLQRFPARFIALYADAVRRGCHHAPGVVFGSIDRANAARGYSLEGPVFRARTMQQIMARTKARPALPPAPADDQTEEYLDMAEAVPILERAKSELADMARRKKLN